MHTAVHQGKSGDNGKKKEFIKEGTEKNGEKREGNIWREKKR